MSSAASTRSAVVGSAPMTAPKTNVFTATPRGITHPLSIVIVTMTFFRRDIFVHPIAEPRSARDDAVAPDRRKWRDVS